MTKKIFSYRNIKIFLIGLVVLISGSFFIYYLNRNLYRSKATASAANLSFIPNNLALKLGEVSIPISLILQFQDGSANEKIDYLKLILNFPKENLELVDYIDTSTSGLGRQIRVDRPDLANNSGQIVIELGASSSGSGPTINTSLITVAKLKFRGKSIVRNSQVTIGSVQIVNNLSASITTINKNNFSFSVSFSCDVNNCGQNASCQNNSCVCNSGYYNCDGRWENGCESNQACNTPTLTRTLTPTSTIIPTPTPTGSLTPTPTSIRVSTPTITLTPYQQSNTPTLTRTLTPTSTIIPTPTPTGSLTPTPTLTNSSSLITLNLKLKFQGVMREPLNNNQKIMNVRIKVGGGNLSTPVSVEANFNLTNNRNSENDALIWEGSVNLPSQVVPGQNYYLLVKGPKHIQKKICESNPQETTGGSYRCRGENRIILSSGQNNLDFSKIYLLSGDLPINGIQDGVVDSLDTSFIRNNLGRTNPETISIADLNLDGRIDTQDWSMVIYALSIKTDEE